MITIRNVAIVSDTVPFSIDDWVHKPKGSYWEGRVVGYYSTKQTPEGYCVQLLGMENGPVQIYPRSALVLGRDPRPRAEVSYPLGSTEPDLTKD
ncbi:dihydrofolate reductase protein [Rhizobium phage RHph_I1_6]|uniref:Dihydrofolate reductase protein n=1 Tax=Rhizobium phage RHph_I1_6 TaxID=2509728 RepID=A0A7S5V0L9_9CAUD|nr:dihydrofolate reductase protein [Rhizobium phage RHph_I1_6]QIG76593.1 dihydrofolate reductase protein [Rhizobium phage RHph_I1_6]